MTVEDWPYGPCALVVGASEGLGAAFAEELAARGSDLVLVARRQAPLDELANRLRSEHGVRVRSTALDAGTPDGIATLARAGEDIGLIVCNAALSPIRPFLELTPAQLDAMLDLNCRSAAHLVHAFGPRLVARGRGGVVLLSSMAANQGSALVAHYAATKAYLRVLAEGLWAELGPSGIDVLASCPGPVDTPGFGRSAPTGRLVPPPMWPSDVARETLAALGRRPVVVPGRWNRIAAFAAARLLSRRQAVRLISSRTRAMYRPGSPRPAPADEPDR
ncbi:MAG TPA: SDR family NAD(P)-dependent oxidoreductase [Amycolatopsis sp.]|nr:SDR family NAD(P)-dependent oxidoreductase [Amycolatopsis sp.]